MTIKTEVTLNSFDFWAGAKDNAKLLTMQELDEVEAMLEDIYCDEELTDTELNDLFWFDFDTVCEWLGLDPEEVAERE